MANDDTLAWSRTSFGDSVSQAANIPIASRICRTYRLILEDAVELDPHIERMVARRLTAAIWHFALGPLKAVFLRAADGQARDNLRMQLKALFYWLMVAETKRRDSLHDAILYSLSLPQEMKRPMCISAISPLELLARLCWKQNHPADIGLSPLVPLKPRSMTHIWAIKN